MQLPLAMIDDLNERRNIIVQKSKVSRKMYMVALCVKNKLVAGRIPAGFCDWENQTNLKNKTTGPSRVFIYAYHLPLAAQFKARKPSCTPHAVFVLKELLPTLSQVSPNGSMGTQDASQQLARAVSNWSRVEVHLVELTYRSLGVAHVEGHADPEVRAVRL